MIRRTVLFFFSNIGWILGVLFVLCLMLHMAIVGHCQTTDWRALLGDPDMSYRDLRTPVHGILVHTNGFQFGRSAFVEDRIKANGKHKLARTPKYLVSMNAANLVGPFVSQAELILDGVDGPDTYICRKIDEAFETVLNRRLACGKSRAAAQNFDPRTLEIQVWSEPWWVPAVDVYAAGECSPDGRHLRVVILVATHLFDGVPGNETLNLFYDYARWEIGNAMAIAAGEHWDGTVVGEIGDRDPCQF